RTRAFFGTSITYRSRLSQEMRRHVPPLDLSCRCPWYGVRDVNHFRRLEVRQPLAAMFLNLRRGRSPFQDDRRMNFLAVLGVRSREAYRLGHRWMFQQGRVHLERRDLLAAAIDELLDSPGQRQVTVLVQKSLIARAKIAARERSLVRVG